VSRRCKILLMALALLTTLLLAGYWYAYRLSPCRGPDGNPAPCWDCPEGCPVRFPR